MGCRRQFLLDNYKVWFYFRDMIKKVTNLAIIGMFLFGMGAPLLALVQSSQDMCGMTCCTVDMSHSQDVEASDNSPNSCPMTASTCVPAPVPTSLDIQAELQTNKTQQKFIIQIVDFGYNSVNDTPATPSFIKLDHDLVIHSQRDLLSKHSILII